MRGPLKKLVALYLVLYTLSLIYTSAYASTDSSTEWNVVNDIFNNAPFGVGIAVAGPDEQPFVRKVPLTLDPNLLSTFQSTFDLMQDITADGDNVFTGTSKQYVAGIPGAFVEGEGGLVYDSNGNVYHLPYFFSNRNTPAMPMPQHPVSIAQQQCQHYSSLATVIQRYGHMYYHFLEETLLRIVMLQNSGVFLPDTKLLVWNQTYEWQYLKMLGIRDDQIVAYDPEAVYCADMLLVPTPIPRITPPREPLEALRSALRVETLPEAERNIIIYVSRENEPTRSVANEADILRSIQTAYPKMQLVVFTGNMEAGAIIQLFQKARVIIGPHGAGLAHMIFAAPDTTVIEFIFMAEPPLMFWHTAAALGQKYWMIPIPNSWYMQRSMTVPVGEVMDVLQATLGSKPASNTCPPGTAGATLCSPCPPGSYSHNAGSLSCKLCFAGRVNAKRGSSYCSTCPAGTFSNPSGTACLECPEGSYSSIPGASDATQCLTAEGRRAQLENTALSVEMLSKLSPVFAKSVQRRALIQGVDTGSTSTQLCQALVAAGTFADAYSGPYKNAVGVICPPFGSNSTVPLLPDGTLVVPTPQNSYGIQDMNGVVVVPPIDHTQPIIVPSPDPYLGDKDLQSIPVPAPAPSPPFKKKKVLDDWTIILIAIICILILIPVIYFARKWYLSKRRHDRQNAARAGSATAASSKAAATSTKSKTTVGSLKGKKQPMMMQNSLYEVNAISSTAQP